MMVASKPDPNDVVITTTKASGADIDEPLPPRHKLPLKLQAIVDKAEKEDSLYDELWEGTYVSLVFPSIPSIRIMGTEQKLTSHPVHQNPQNPKSATQHMPPESVRLYYRLSAMSHTPQISVNLSAQ